MTLSHGDNGAIVALISGGHASGKRSGAYILKDQLEKLFGGSKISIKLINMNNYLITSEKQNFGSRQPNDYDFIRLRDDLNLYIDRIEYEVIIVYGLYALFDKQICDLATVRIFIDCDADVRLGRWIKRDVLTESHEGKTDQEVEDLKEQEKIKLEKLLNVYLNYSRQEMKLYINDTKENADIILPRGADATGFKLIVDGLKVTLLPLLQTTHRSDSQTSTFSENRSGSFSNRDTFIQNLKNLSSEPSVMSLTNDNFTNTKKIFYDLN